MASTPEPAHRIRLDTVCSATFSVTALHTSRTAMKPAAAKTIMSTTVGMGASSGVSIVSAFVHTGHSMQTSASRLWLAWSRTDVGRAAGAESSGGTVLPRLSIVVIAGI